MKCGFCGFEAPVWEWTMEEKSGYVRMSLDELASKDLSKAPFGVRLLVTLLKGKKIPIPYHETLFKCPKCGKYPKEIRKSGITQIKL